MCHRAGRTRRGHPGAGPDAPPGSPAAANGTDTGGATRAQPALFSLIDRVAITRARRSRRVGAQERWPVLLRRQGSARGIACSRAIALTAGVGWERREDNGIGDARATRRDAMDQLRVDALARRLAAAPTRRHLLRTLAATLLAGGDAKFGLRPVTAGSGSAGDPCRRRRHCARPLICQDQHCCVKTGGECIADTDCCSTACDEASGTCLCPITFEPLCGDRCCNPLTETCVNDRCCREDGVACRRNSQCCNGSCTRGRCGSGSCTGTNVHFCPPTPDYPQGLCCHPPPGRVLSVGQLCRLRPGGIRTTPVATG